MNEKLLEGQVVLIIGAGRWPGPQLALALASQGATVAANDLSPVLLDPLCEAAGPFSGKIRGYTADATRGMPLRAMLDEVMEDWGKIDVLINNPRVAPSYDLLDMDEWDWQRTVEMNLNGPFLASKLAARSMQAAQRKGVIINIVDTTDFPGLPGHSAYAASQAALLSFSQSAAREFIAYNIRVYTLCPDRDILHQPKPLAEVTAELQSSRNPEAPLAKVIVSILDGSYAGEQVGHTIFVN